jgi:hypothetical protein
MSLTEVKKQVQASRKLSSDLKEKILPLLTSSSRYNNGAVYGLRTPNGMSKISSKISGCGFGADKNGFFCYTHRGRCKSNLN